MRWNECLVVQLRLTHFHIPLEDKVWRTQDTSCVTLLHVSSPTQVEEERQPSNHELSVIVGVDEEEREGVYGMPRK